MTGCGPRALLVGLVVVLAGCSSTVDGQGSAGSGGAALTGWAASYCAAAQPLARVEAQDEQRRAAVAEVGTAAEARDALADLYTAYAIAFQQTATAVGALPPPPVDGAQDFPRQAQQAYERASRDAQGVVDQVDALDVSTTAAVGVLAGQLQASSSPYGSSLDQLDEDTPAAVAQAIRSTPGCPS